MEKATFYLSSGQTVTVKAKSFTVVRDSAGQYANLKWEGTIKPVPLIWPSAAEVVTLTVT